MNVPVSGLPTIVPVSYVVGSIYYACQAHDRLRHSSLRQ